MIRAVCLIASLIIAGNSLDAPTTPAPEKEKSDNDLLSLQGTWAAIGFFRGTESVFDESRCKGYGLVVKGNKYYQGRLNSDQLYGYANFELRPKRSPKQIDFFNNAIGSRIDAIYDLEGDRLRILFNLATEPRPTGFKINPGARPYLWIYKRK